MFVVVTGGSGSGKSAYAEDLAVKLHQQRKESPFIYIATMFPYEEQEVQDKIKRHQRMREEKGFQTIECFTHLKNINLPMDSIVLLDCMSNLTANELFHQNGAKEETVAEIIKGLHSLKSRCNDVVIVTNELFSDGMEYEESMITYLKTLGKLNQHMAKMADQVVEVVYGIPVFIS